MKVLIAGGSGFVGRNLSASLLRDGHQVYVLTRGKNIPAGTQAVQWDARTTAGWGYLVNEMDAVIHLAGKSLSTWPWTSATKRSFLDSRLQPGLALVQAIQAADRRPGFFLQQSGINHYGLHGSLSDESIPPAYDFLAQVTVQWEGATKPLEELGVRRVITRTGVVLAKGEGLMPLMTLPVQMFFGGPIGPGTQALPWIHIKDWVGAARFLMENENARGAYNLVAPMPSSNAEFNRALAEVLHRPYWFPVPSFLMRTFLGEMSVLIVDGRPSQPKRLTELGYRFQFPGLQEALLDLYGK